VALDELVPTAQSQVLQKHLNSRVSRFLGFQKRRYIALMHSVGKWLAAHMDQKNL